MNETLYIPQKLVRVEQEGFKIIWGDNHESRYSAQQLRLQCPCAACRDEWTGEARIHLGMISENLELKDASLVGNYAIHFIFSDGHTTGIYSFETLRKICSCDSCQKSKKTN